MAREHTSQGFPSPFDVPIPADCEGWEDMYAYHVVFSEDRTAFDEGRFWFQDAVHTPEPVAPFDSVWFDYAVVAFNQANARLFALPPSLGIEHRLLNGYVYVSANAVTDDATLARRTELFTTRGGHYYRNWDQLYDRWVEKVERTNHELEALVVPQLPELEDEAVVTEARGVGSSYQLLVAYDRLLESLDLILQYHFELLNLGYTAYLAFYELCRHAFPDITDQAIAKMVSGIDLLVLRPDEELKRLARVALELGVAEQVKAATTEDELRASVAQSEAGATWLADFDETKDPWFYFSYGTGAYHHHHSWIDDTTMPIASIGGYIGALEAGGDINRPHAAVLAERQRITDGHRSLLDDGTRQPFDENLELARTVFPLIENHQFYIDHRFFTIFWNKVREFGALLAEADFLSEQEDVFYLRHDELRQALEELRLDWSSAGAGAARGPVYWPPIVERRRSIHEEMREWAPPPALGQIPKTITDPVTVMLWGITDERVQDWLSASDGSGERTLTGFAGSPGAAEGCARVVLRPEQLGELEEGEILVAPTTSTSWTPVFGKIAAAVLDSGGIMCHAAIVAREYGLPAVVGTGTGTKRIKTGDRLRVDADSGVITILD
jgi:phosphohistidine swiveling domain-containing protein